MELVGGRGRGGCSPAALLALDAAQACNNKFNVLFDPHEASDTTLLHQAAFKAALHAVLLSKLPVALCHAEHVWTKLSRPSAKV